MGCSAGWQWDQASCCCGDRSCGNRTVPWRGHLHLHSPMSALISWLTEQGCTYSQTTAPNSPVWVSPCPALPGREGWLLLLPWEGRAAVLARQLEQDPAALEENKACLSCGSKARGGAGGEQHAGQLVVASHCPCHLPLQLCLQAERYYTAPRRNRVVAGALKLLGLSCSESIFQAAT